MINYIWVGMTLTGLIYAICTGSMDKVTEALFSSANDAVTLCFGLISVLVLWLGLMRIAQDSGLLAVLSRLLRPLAKRIFPDVPPDHPAMGYILSNMIANLLGLGNAATPLGIKAMEELQILNAGLSTASRSMITFLAVNNTSITLIPTTVIAIRMTYQSASPTDIVVPSILATAVSALAAIAIDRFYYRHRKPDGGK